MNITDDQGYRLGDWVVLPSCRTLERDGQLFTPRAKIFDLLIFLLDHHDRLVSREELLSQLWQDQAISENSLPQAIIELRKLLGDDARNPRFIKTIPKAGYQIVGPVERLRATAVAGAVVSLEEVTTSRVEYLEITERGPAVLLRMAFQSKALVAISLAACTIALGVLVSRNFQSRAEVSYREVAWWKFDDAGEVARDASNHGEHGIVAPGARWTQGKMQGGVRLDGMNGAVSGLGHGALPSGSESRTISLWIKTDLPPVDSTGLFVYGSDYREPTPERFFLILGTDGRLECGVAQPGGTITGGMNVDDGGWHMITVTYQGPPDNHLAIYVDGRLDTSRRLSAVPATNSRARWRIGQNLPGNASFRGVIDDVRVYNNALDASKVRTLYRYSSGQRDLDGYSFFPIFTSGTTIHDHRPDELSSSFENDGKDFAGIQLGRCLGVCSLAEARGADMGQDLKMSVDLMVPSGPDGHTTDAGPYFRSRAAMAGDGLIGGTSAGYWVQLYSTGMVKIKRLNPPAVVAFSAPPHQFDSRIFHHLDAKAHGEQLQVWLDGRLLVFDQGGKRLDSIAIPSVWNGPPRIGDNHGAAGVAFGSEENRGALGGQRAKNLQISRW